MFPSQMGVGLVFADHPGLGEVPIGEAGLLFHLRFRQGRAPAGAMSYAETMKMLDLMLLVATLDNRNEIEELRDTVQRLDRRLDKLVA